MTYLRERGVSKRALALVLSLLMVFSMFTMLTGYAANGAADYGLRASPAIDAIELTWDAQEGADGYTVFRSNEIDGTYTEWGDTTSNTFRDTLCMPQTTYYYKVRSYKYVTRELIEVFTIRAESYEATTDGMFVYENTSDSQLHFKSYASTPSPDDNPEAYWYIDLDGHIRNYATDNYASIGTDTVASVNGSGTYGNAPMNVYASATADGDNSEWIMQSLTCDSAKGADKGGTSYVIYLLSSGGLKQWTSGRQKTNDGLLAASTVNKSEFTGSCGRHWKVENQKIIGGTTEKVEGELSEPASATPIDAGWPIIRVDYVEPVTAYAGSEFTVTAHISNAGPEFPTESFSVLFSFGSATEAVYVTDLTEITVTGSTTVSTTFVAPEDVFDGSQYTVNVSANGGSMDGTVTVNAPLIQVNSVGSFEATAGSAIQFDVVLKNIGHMDYAGGDNMSVVFNNGTEQLVALPPIPMGQEVTVSATDVAPSQNGQYTVTASVDVFQSSSSASGTVTVTGGDEPDDKDPYPNTPTKDPTTAPDFSVDYAEFVSGPYFIRNNYTGYGYQYLYDSLDGNDYTGREDNRNGSDSTSYADYGRTFRQVNTDDVLSSIQNNQNYMWNIYSKTVGGTTYYMLRNVGTGRYIHTGAYGDYYSYNNDNNSANMYAWNAEITNGATGYNGDSQANRELSYYAFTLPSYNNTTGESFTTQIVNQRFAWGQRPLHGELASDHNTTERAGRVFFTSNTNGWATKNWYFNPANVATTVADLTVTSATIDPTDIPFGTEATVSATIKNDGNADIAEGTPILVKFVFNGKLATATYTGGLAAGASTDVSATIKPNKLTDGAVMTVTVNADWSLDESDFTNNTYTVENITVIDNDSPVVAIDSVENTIANAGSAFTANAVVKNIGGATQTEPFDVVFVLGNQTETVRVTDEIEAGGTLAVHTNTLVAPADAEDQATYDIKVSVNRYSKSGTLTVNAPKFVVTAVNADNAIANTVFQVTATVKNIGHMDFEGTQNIKFEFEGQTETATVTSLAVDATVDVYATFMAGAVNGTFDVTANVNNDAPVTGKVTVTGGDDADTDPEAPTEPGKSSSYYVIQSVQRNTFLADTGLNENGTIRAALASSTWDDASADKRYQWEMVDAGSGKYYLRNIATGRYLQTDGDTYYDYTNYGNDGSYNHNGVALVDSPTDRKAALTLTLNSTESNGNKLYTMRDDQAFASWGYYINTYHDTEKLQISIVNINNSRLFRFAEYNISPADIVVTNVALSETDIDFGDEATATVTIKNVGGTAVEAGTNIKVKVSFNGVIAFVTYSDGLGVNEEAVVEITFKPNKMTEGAVLTATANSDWTVEESDYTNNIYTVNDITVNNPVVAPDMKLNSFEAVDADTETAPVYAGKEFKFIADVSNVGSLDAAAQDYTVTIYQVDENLNKTVFATHNFNDAFTANESKKITITVDKVLDAGAYTYEAEITPAIDEVKTGNNSASLGFTVIPQDPDLELVSVNASVKTVDGVDCATLNATVRNNRYSAKVDGTVTVTFTVSNGTDTQTYTVTRDDGISAESELQFVKDLTGIAAGNYTVTATVSFEGNDRDDSNDTKETTFKVSNFKNVAIQRDNTYTAYRQFIDIYTTVEDPSSLVMVRFKGAYNTYEELIAAYAAEYSANGNSFLNNPEWTATGTSTELLEAYKQYPILNILNRTWGETPKTYADENNNLYTECGYFSAIDDTDDNSAPVEYTVLIYSPTDDIYSVVPVTASNFDYKQPTVTGEVVTDANLGKLLKITMTSGASGIASATYNRVYGGGAFVHPYAILDYDESYAGSKLTEELLGRDLNANPNVVEAYIRIPSDEKSLWYALGVVSGSGNHNFTNISIPQSYSDSVSVYNNMAPHYDADGNAYYPHSFFRFTTIGGTTVKREVLDVSDMNVTSSIERLIMRGGTAYWNKAVDIGNKPLYYVSHNGNYYIRSTSLTGETLIQNYKFTDDVCRVDSNAPVAYDISSAVENGKSYVTAYSYDIGRYLAIYVTDENNVKHYVYAANEEYDVDEEYEATVTFGEKTENASIPTVNAYNTVECVKVKAAVTGGRTVQIGFIDFGGRETKKYIYVPAQTVYQISATPAFYAAGTEDDTGKMWYPNSVVIFKQSGGKNADRKIINASALGLDETAVEAILSGENTQVWESDSAVTNNSTCFVAKQNGLYIIRSVSEKGDVAYCTVNLDCIIEK